MVHVDCQNDSYRAAFYYEKTWVKGEAANTTRLRNIAGGSASGALMPAMISGDSSSIHIAAPTNRAGRRP